MNISEFTETRIRYNQNGKEALHISVQGGMCEAMASLIKLAQENPNDPIKILSTSIVKRKGNNAHELFV
jgi:hypothetical protein